MDIITDYITLRETSIPELDISVLKYIGKGWQPYFGPSMRISNQVLQGIVFYQTMVKYKDG